MQKRQKTKMMTKKEHREFIAAIEETMTPEEKNEPSFIAYKAASKKKKDRTPRENFYYATFQFAMAMADQLEIGDDGRVGFPSHTSAERELNEAFDREWEKTKDERLQKFKDHVDGLHRELEEMTGKKFAKPERPKS